MIDAMWSVRQGVSFPLGLASGSETTACEYGIVRPIGNRRRGEYYQSDDLIAVLDEISSVQGIRRLVATGMK